MECKVTETRFNRATLRNCISSHSSSLFDCKINKRVNKACLLQSSLLTKWRTACGVLAGEVHIVRKRGVSSQQVGKGLGYQYCLCRCISILETDLELSDFKAEFISRFMYASTLRLKGQRKLAFSLYICMKQICDLVCWYDFLEKSVVVSRLDSKWKSNTVLWVYRQG